MEGRTTSSTFEPFFLNGSNYFDKMANQQNIPFYMPNDQYLIGTINDMENRVMENPYMCTLPFQLIPASHAADTFAITSPASITPATISPNENFQENLTTAQIPVAAPKNSKIKRNRTKYSVTQIREFEKEFRNDPYLSRRRRLELSTNLLLTERQVKVWFQNKRMKLKKEQRGSSASPLSTSSLSSLEEAHCLPTNASQQNSLCYQLYQIPNYQRNQYHQANQDNVYSTSYSNNYMAKSAPIYEMITPPLGES